MKFDSIQGYSLVLKYVNDKIYHQMLVPSDKVYYKSQIGINKKFSSFRSKKSLPRESLLSIVGDPSSRSELEHISIL